MPRKPRDKAAGIFHVYTHCVYASTRHYRDDLDRLTFLRRLALVTERTRWKCMAFCLMGTHYHLIVGVDDGLLPAAMHALNLGYAKDFNRRYGLKGHVQFAPYGAGRVSSDVSLASRFRYVARNPVRAGLCEAPEDWPWSSYAGTIGAAEPSTFVDDSSILALYDDIAELRAQVRDS